MENIHPNQLPIVTFDTLQAVKRLKKSGINTEKAEALAQAMKSISDFHFQHLATKQDLKHLSTTLTLRMVIIMGGGVTILASMNFFS